MGFALRLCLLLLISEVCVLANPLIPQDENAPNPTDAPNPTEASKSTDAPNPTEASKSTDAPNPTEASKSTDAPNPTEASKSTDAPNPTEASKPDVIQDAKPTVLDGEDATLEPDPAQNPEDSSVPGVPSGSGESTTEASESTTATGRSSFSTPCFILCVSVLMPVFVANKL